MMVMLGYVLSFGLMGAIAWTFWSAARDIVAVAKQMHRIPCANCRYFTNDHRLKCPVHPQIANTERAIDCRDYQRT